MDISGIGWVMMSGIGVLLLAAAMAFAAARNRSSRDVIRKSEAATRDLYKEEDEAHRDDGSGRV